MIWDWKFSIGTNQSIRPITPFKIFNFGDAFQKLYCINICKMLLTIDVFLELGAFGVVFGGVVKFNFLFRYTYKIKKA